MVINGAATAGVAWLLDPAIKKIFIEKDKLMLYVIPAAIVITFLIKISFSILNKNSDY